MADDPFTLRIFVPDGDPEGVRIMGAPSYFATRPKPRKPQELADHQCINLRLPTAGGLYSWEQEKRGRELRVRVEGQLAFNNVPMIVRTAMAGFGLACVLEDQVKAQIAEGSLVRVLDDWCPPFAGYHLLSESTAALGGVRAAGRRAASSWLRVGARPKPTGI
jgi:DNA-binding transcriptional LysR family regulator